MKDYMIKTRKNAYGNVIHILRVVYKGIIVAFADFEGTIIVITSTDACELFGLVDFENISDLLHSQQDRSEFDSFLKSITQAFSNQEFSILLQSR